MKTFSFNLIFIICMLVLCIASCSEDIEVDCHDICINNYDSYYTTIRSSNYPTRKLIIKAPLQNVSFAKNSDGFLEFSGENLQYLSLPGDPEIPYQVVSILLPADADLSYIQVSGSINKIESIPGKNRVRVTSPGATYCKNNKIVVWPHNVDLISGKNELVYSSNMHFPKKIIKTENIRTGKLRNWKIIDVPVALFTYNPQTEQLSKLTSAELTITYGIIQLNSKQGVSFIDRNDYIDEIGKKRVQQFTVNFMNTSRTYRSFDIGHPISKEYDISNKKSYVVLTTNLITYQLTELKNFIKHKEERGYNVQVITEEQWGGGRGNVAAENIRSWLRSNYLRLNIEYLLLIGDPTPADGDVPMKMLYPRNNSTCYIYYKNAPSDLYYAELNGNWDLDGDGFSGEWSCNKNETGDFGPGGVDNYTEIIVGRIPFYSTTTGSEIDIILKRTIDYVNESNDNRTWRNSVMMPIPEEGNSAKYLLGERIKDDILGPKDFTYHRLYDINRNLLPAPETIPCTKENVLKTWNNNNFGMLIWSTHGSTDNAASVIDVEGVKNLRVDKSAFIFQVSCLNSNPDNYNNLSFELLKKRAISVIGATRVSWYNYGDYISSPYNARLAYEYALNIITHEMNSGYAWQKMIRELIPHSASTWMNMLVYNIYGDPEVGLYTSTEK